MTGVDATTSEGCERLAGAAAEARPRLARGQGPDLAALAAALPSVLGARCQESGGQTEALLMALLDELEELAAVLEDERRAYAGGR